MVYILILAINNDTSSKQDRQLPQAGNNAPYQPSFNTSRQQASRASRKARKPQSKHNTLSRESVIAVLKDTPAVAAFDVHFKDSLPPIKGSEVHLHGAEGGRGRSRGAADGEEVDWQPTSHYDRYIIKLITWQNKGKLQVGHVVLSTMFSCDGMSDHDGCNEGFHY